MLDKPELHKTAKSFIKRTKIVKEYEEALKNKSLARNPKFKLKPDNKSYKTAIKESLNEKTTGIINDTIDLNLI